jgi:hypothetical protein
MMGHVACRTTNALRLIGRKKTAHKQLKLLTARAYLSVGPGFDAGPKMERKDKDPCPHLSLFGPIVARPRRSPECVLTPRRSFVWFSPASTI